MLGGSTMVAVVPERVPSSPSAAPSDAAEASKVLPGWFGFRSYNGWPAYSPAGKEQPMRRGAWREPVVAGYNTLANGAKNWGEDSHGNVLSSESDALGETAGLSGDFSPQGVRELPHRSDLLSSSKAPASFHRERLDGAVREEHPLSYLISPDQVEHPLSYLISPDQETCPPQSTRSDDSPSGSVTPIDSNKAAPIDQAKTPTPSERVVHSTQPRAGLPGHENGNETSSLRDGFSKLKDFLPRRLPQWMTSGSPSERRENRFSEHSRAADAVRHTGKIDLRGVTSPRVDHSKGDGGWKGDGGSAGRSRSQHAARILDDQVEEIACEDIVDLCDDDDNDDEERGVRTTGRGWTSASARSERPHRSEKWLSLGRRRRSAEDDVIEIDDGVSPDHRSSHRRSSHQRDSGEVDRFLEGFERKRQRTNDRGGAAAIDGDSAPVFGGNAPRLGSGASKSGGHGASEEADGLEIIDETSAAEGGAGRERMMIASTVVGSFSCPICLDDRTRGEQVCYLGCGHRLCFDCATRYVMGKVTDAKVSRAALRCPIPECKRPLSVVEVKGCLADAPDALARYERFALKQYLESDDRTFFCPTSGCDFAAELGGAGGHAQRFECPCCQEAFCLNCKAAWHKGLTCDEYARSADVPKEERELATRAIQMGMKQCPQCKFWVEKDEGCNAMVCRCGTTFCWRCGEDVNRRRDGCRCLRSLQDLSPADRLDVLSVNAHATNPDNPAHNHFQRHFLEQEQQQQQQQQQEMQMQMRLVQIFHAQQRMRLTQFQRQRQQGSRQAREIRRLR